MINWKRGGTFLGIAAVGLALLANATDSMALEKKYKVYLAIGVSGHAWINAAANMIKALAATPPYDKQVELHEIISGPDSQKQISDFESMIASGADAILGNPNSTTALNRVVKRGCDKGIVMFMFESTVTEPCAYNISTITGGFGENSAQALVNMLNGKGKIFVIQLIPGSIAGKRHYEGAMHIFKKYPRIKTVEYFGMATDETVQEETAKALAAHPDVEGIWSTAGEYGAVKALLATGRQNLLPITGESSNGFRLALADPELQKRGLRGVSSGGTPATAGYAFKLMMEMLTKQRTMSTHNVEYPLPWVEASQVKVCSGDRFENGCNVFPKGKVPDSFFTEALSPVLLPELSLISILEGKPTPGATIQKLPTQLISAPNVPGMNCQKCPPPADLYRLTKVNAIAKP
jgi:ribose transport system substrate-binding protein